jgi:predicted secreted protein
MSTKAIAGRKGKVYLGASSSAAATALAELRDFTMTVTGTHIDATSFDSSGWMEFIDGEKGWTLKAGMVNLSTNSNQQTLVSMFSSGTRFWWQVQPTTAKTQKWSGFGRLETYDVAQGTKDLSLRNSTIRGSGPLKYTA